MLHTSTCSNSSLHCGERKRLLGAQRRKAAPRTFLSERLLMYEVSVSCAGHGLQGRRAAEEEERKKVKSLMYPLRQIHMGDCILRPDQTGPSLLWLQKYLHSSTL